jgi:RNA polymerase sigma-70 factor, ECF subfamily
MTVTDEALMRAVRDGDLARLGTLFDRHHTGLFDYLKRSIGNRAAAEDIVQDVFVRILRYRATYREDGAFETWLYGIARNARADYFRTRRNALPLSEEALESPDAGPGPDRQAEQERETAQLRHALQLLREDKRELIVLARYRDMKYEAIAELLGVDVGTVKVRVHRAIKELRGIYLQMKERPSCDVKSFPRSLPSN